MHNCGTPGHYANECRRPRSEIKVVGKEYCVNNQEFIKSEMSVRKINKHRRNGFWNSCNEGASTNACNDESLFDTINPEDSVIVVGDDCEIKVKGTVKLKLKANEVVNTLGRCTGS